MAFEIAGYVLEGMRLGQANAPFTQGPDNLVSDQAAFHDAYPADESAPRADYMVLVTSEGPSERAGLLESSEFGWTKNEVVERFTYDAQRGAFKPLRGAPPVEVGVLSADSNEQRLRVRPPVQAGWEDTPYRLSVGSVGSGEMWSVQVVEDDLSFSLPSSLPTKTAELSMATGNLNWSEGDLTAYVGRRVRFQQQQFYALKDSTGKLGTAPDPDLATAPAMLLNPLPGPGQFPRLRFGYGFYLTTEEKETEEDLTEVAVGTVQWAADTGRLRFNPADVATHAGTPVYYDGVLFKADAKLPSQSLGLITAPSAITDLPEAGGDLIFVLVDATPYYRFPDVVYRTSFDAGKKGEVQVNPMTGAVSFSDADMTAYGGMQVDVYFGDLLIDHGVSVRFLRNPVNLDASALPPLKDVTRIYTLDEDHMATWADPIIQSPQVSLPSLPIEDPAYPTRVDVVQGQGSYTKEKFPNLNVPAPDPGLGYYIDFDQGLLFFAERKEDVIVPILSLTSDVVLPDPLLLASGIKLELVTDMGSTELTIGEDALVDTTAGVVSLVLTNTLLMEGTASVTGTTLTDPGTLFSNHGVQAGQLIVLNNEAVYTIASVSPPPPPGTTLELDLPVPAPLANVSYAIYEGREILADRYFAPVELIDPSTKVERIRLLGVASNAPPLSVPLAYVESSGFRLGASQSDPFATVVSVADDGAFGSPSAGTVELSEETGNLNFSADDLGKSIYWARELTPGKDYELQPELGLVYFKDRMLSGEEARIRYTVAPPSTIPRTLPGDPITEYATFLIRKEITEDHPAPTSTLAFNPEGRPVALNPPPAVFRGGRPQKLGVQCVVDPVSSRITFLPDGQLTDALPHGATINPNERVYIDYYVTRAVGGEQTFTVLQPPILTSAVTINEIDADGAPNNHFVVLGEHTETFLAGHLMRIENEQVYLLAGASYDPVLKETTVTLAGSQVFQSAFTDPNLYVSSGPTPITTEQAAPAYFAEESNDFEAIARGSNTFLLAGDQAERYRPGVVVLFTHGSGGEPFTDFLQVSGSAYDAGTDRTSVMLTANSPRQYLTEQQFLYRSVRPIFEPPVTQVQTSLVPKLTEPYVVYRREVGQVGQVLVSPVDYTINDSGLVVFAEPLGIGEEFGIFYTGLTTVDPVGGPSLSLKASYTCQIAPSTTNGLLGQTLLAAYSIDSPDTFYYRVETMTNFRGEFEVEIKQDAGSGTSGPQTSNFSQPKLWEQGRKSLYFDERHLANQDIVARATLLFYNDLATLLESYKRALDGTVVGNNDGSFLFDGTTGTLPVPPAVPSNQIDDLIKVSSAPYVVSGPPFTVVSQGTYRKYYTPGMLSRFYPTQKHFFGVPAITGTTAEGDEVLDTGAENITLVEDLHTRLAWALVTKQANAGATTLEVDDADGSAEHVRPPFMPEMKCVIQRRDGSFVHGTSTPVTISSVASTLLTLDAPGLSGTVTMGCTIYRAPNDDSQSVPNKLTNHVLYRDYSFQSETGQITYVPSASGNTPLLAGQAVTGQVSFTNTATAPEKIPALYGGIEDDDGELSFPIQTPDPNSEPEGHLEPERLLIEAILDLTDTASVTLGSLVETSPGFSTTLNYAGGVVPPTLLQNDLARIMAGVNATAFRRVTPTGPGQLSVSLSDAWVYQSGNVAVEIATANVVAQGTTAYFPQATVLTDSAANFTSNVKVGETVVITSGANQGLRRQIESITNGQTLVLDKPVDHVILPPPPASSPSSYRIIASLTSYGNTPSDMKTTLAATVASELPLYQAEQQYLLDVLSLAFADYVQPAPLTGIITGVRTLTDPQATFEEVEVNPRLHLIYIASGANAGVYTIKEVVSETVVMIGDDESFPDTVGPEVNVTYRVVSVFGLSAETAQAIFEQYRAAALQYSQALAFLNLLTSTLGVASDPDAYATTLRDDHLEARLAQIESRKAELPSALAVLADIFVNIDKLYDKRYVWVDARINLEDGLLVRQDTAIKNRIKAQADIIKQLTKLLAVENA